jgi:precorrin-8X/cobalt-precorrin-8 methylmutase
VLAAIVREEAANANNRWTVAAELNRRVGSAPGPFWCCPPSAATPELCIRKGRFPHVGRDGRTLSEYRIVDERLRRSGRMVQSVWKLFTTGSVGSQTLLGIPWVHRLRTERRLARVSRVWPFETGLTPSLTARAGPAIVHVEVWPRIVPHAGDPNAVLDARQVTTLGRHLAERDVDGTLVTLFQPPAGLGTTDVATVTGEEGWVLGA